MRDVATQTLETLGMLYATAFGVDHFARVLDAISELIGGNGALLFVDGAGPAELRGAAFSGVLLLLIDPDHREMISVQGLAESYVSTATETLVCRMIAQGMTLREIADARRVGLDTVKSQSRAIYAKTHTRNRRGLVRRALSIVPPLLDRSGKRIP